MARFEFKYRLPDRKRAFLRALWQPFLAKAPFTNEAAEYPVLSQYYDSPDLVFYREKLAGNGHRKKVRLRTYGWRFRPGEVCFLEIKHRTHELVYKTRVRVPEFRREFLEPNSWPALGDETGPFCALSETHRLRRTAQVLYLREAYQGVLEPNLRVTFDSALVGLHPGETVTWDLLAQRSRAVLPETEVILEIKAQPPLPSWIRRGIRWADLQQETVPKYVMAVESLNLVKLATGVYT